ncbi:hypothetical protein TNCV_1358211 [Trichonephila clavipes]|uniref:Uncharacterized protein n=1 Tax=Trichonephila clavipes TaxID=2585209 RepID=A0A8X6SBW1_TRICX|nr:hypothetical protein TNCV_1358211 [Trichonephila clavipes]
MPRYLSYVEEMRYLKYLLDIVSTNKESFYCGDDEEFDDEEYNSNHDSPTEIDSDLEEKEQFKTQLKIIVL